MRIDQFDWREQFVDKIIVKHNVYPDEVENLFFTHPQIRRIEKGKVKGEDVYRALGQIESGRYLFVVFIYKPSHKSALIVSARDMTQKERRQYERNR